MKILVLSGSPRMTGNTAAFVKAFTEGAESSGNTVDVKVLSTMKYGPCVACDTCRKSAERKCVQRDDLAPVIDALPGYDALVFASPVYYWGFSGQMQAAVSRFYQYGPIPVKKCAMLLSSGSPDVYDALFAQYKSMLGYFKAEDLGIMTFCGGDQKTAENLAKIREFGASLK